MDMYVVQWTCTYVWTNGIHENLCPQPSYTAARYFLCDPIWDGSDILSCELEEITKVILFLDLSTFPWVSSWFGKREKNVDVSCHNDFIWFRVTSPTDLFRAFSAEIGEVLNKSRWAGHPSGSHHKEMTQYEGKILHKALHEEVSTSAILSLRYGHLPAPRFIGWPLYLGRRGKRWTTCADYPLSHKGKAVKTLPSSGQLETCRGGIPSVHVF